MPSPTDYLAARLRRLTDTLVTLKDRVRQAVATELGTAVGDAVKDLLRVVVAGRPAPVPTPPPRSRSTWGYDPDERDEWDDQRDWSRRTSTHADIEDDEDDDPVRPPVAVTPCPARLPTALATGLATSNWLAARKVPAWAGVGLGVLAGVAAWCGGAAADACLAAADLVTRFQ